MLKTSTIPLKIFQTWHSKDLPPAMKEMNDILRKQNQEFEFFLFDVTDCEIFIQKSFGSDVLTAYQSLIPLSYKADLWRYCILYVHGGIYLDISMTSVNNFKFITLTDREHFATDTVLSEYQSEIYKGVVTGMIICKPKNEILLKAIKKIVENVKNKYYGKSPLDPTGPVLLGSFFTDDEKKNFVLKRLINHEGNGVGMNDKLIISRYPEYDNYKVCQYISRWHSKNIYQPPSKYVLPATMAHQGVEDASKSVNNDIIFITAFKDINRGKWNSHTRSNQTYINYFYNLVDNIKYKLVVYLEDDIRQSIKNHKYNDNIIFEDMNKVSTFYNKYVEKDKEIMNSDEFKNKIPVGRKHLPECLYSEYNFINHSKINFVRHTRDIYPNYLFYAWIDFGIMNEKIENIPKNINLKLLPKKIVYHCVNEPPSKRINQNDMFTSNCVYFLGSSYIVHTDLVKLYESLYEEKIIEWQKNCISDDDQNVVLQLYYDNPHIFYKITDCRWFGMYEKLQIPIQNEAIVIGPSNECVKLIVLNRSYKNQPKFILNPHSYNDRFDFEVRHNILIVKRADSHYGWAHNHSVTIKEHTET